MPALRPVKLYAVEIVSMNDARTSTAGGSTSMRRTLLTLLCALGAFGILTASYATAELPQNPVELETAANDR